MLRSDAVENRANVDSFIGKTDFVNMDVISEIEKELQENPYDMISLVFLLYDVPDTALQKLIVYQRVSKDARCTNLNLLNEWFRYAKTKHTWKHELLEALIICQMNNIIRKLGFHVSTLQRHFQPDNISVHMYVNPVKKALYKVCENMTAENLIALKKTLITYDIDTTDYESCEMIFLELMCQKFITMTQFEYNKKAFGFEFKIEKLVRILENLNGMKKLAMELNLLQTISNEKPTETFETSTPLQEPAMEADYKQNKTQLNRNIAEFGDMFKMLADLKIEDEEDLTNFKSDSKKFIKGGYKIKNPDKVGVCLIINQDTFYPSKKSIENGQKEKLDNRLGSDKDEIVLKETMSLLKFKVISHSNLDHEKTFDVIKKVIKDEVRNEDSVFMLCILSHGVRGHVYAADSVKINVEDIENYFDSDEAVKLHGMPKVLVIQACQVDDTAKSEDLLAADSKNTNYYLKKCDFLIYWATAPEYEAFRHEQKGSFFIQILCRILEKRAKKDHLYDIFTEVTNKVVSLCERLQRAQVPIFKSTLRNKLYLQIPQ
ncbi:hypothetical protein K1T71_004112 [Dendrolimus kikuchii]|uniref:Uncharacterized protein n=1 Tax=Dendrolimus kikuchii TaxID=765133 RepID=A0ACC1D9W1_9NEOP|nr:hypothetical protein K1T71_004112 [Dendrolimus kikuchii]